MQIKIFKVIHQHMLETVACFHAIKLQPTRQKGLHPLFYRSLEDYIALTVYSFGHFNKRAKTAPPIEIRCVVVIFSA